MGFAFVQLGFPIGFPMAAWVSYGRLGCLAPSGFALAAWVSYGRLGFLWFAAAPTPAAAASSLSTLLSFAKNIVWGPRAGVIGQLVIICRIASRFSGGSIPRGRITSGPVL